MAEHLPLHFLVFDMTVPPNLRCLVADRAPTAGIGIGFSVKFTGDPALFLLKQTDSFSFSRGIKFKSNPCAHAVCFPLRVSRHWARLERTELG